MAEGDSRRDDRILLLSKVKKICLCFLPLFLGYLFLQNTLNIDDPIAVSTGRSMEPNIHDKSLCLLRHDNLNHQALNGKVIVARIGPDAFTIKRLHITPNGCILCPDNPRYQPICTNAEPADLIIAQVLYEWRALK